MEEENQPLTPVQFIRMNVPDQKTFTSMAVIITFTGRGIDTHTLEGLMGLYADYRIDMLKGNK